jgi:hypothetical protein
MDATGISHRPVIDRREYRLEQPTDDGYYQVCCYYCSVLLDEAGATVGLVCARCDTPFLLEQAYRCPDCGDLHCPACGTTIRRG